MKDGLHHWRQNVCRGEYFTMLNNSNPNMPRRKYKLNNVKKIGTIGFSILGFCAIFLFISSQILGFGYKDILYSSIAEKVDFENYGSNLKGYSYWDPNESFDVGMEKFVFKNSILYHIKNAKEIEIGDLKLDNITNRDDIKNYLFDENEKLFYINNDSLFRVEDKLIFQTKLGENPEGFFVMNKNLYYTYGWQETVTNGTIGGPVNKKYRKYKFRKLNLESLRLDEISKATYLDLRNQASKFGLSGILKDLELSKKTDTEININLKKKAEDLLKNYGLHPISIDEEQTIRLVDNYELIRSNSERIGLNLSGYRGKTVNALIYTLQETSQNNRGKIQSLILYDKEIIGACLLMEGCNPEVSALDEKYNFMPNGLITNNLQFKGINKINIAGPWDRKESLIREVILSNENEINSFLALISKSLPVAKKQNNLFDSSSVEYRICFYYYDGSIVRGNLFFSKDLSTLTLAPFVDLAYESPNELKIFIEQAFKE